MESSAAMCRLSRMTEHNAGFGQAFIRGRTCRYRETPGRVAASAFLPIPRVPSLVRYCEDGHLIGDDLIHHAVREMLEVVASDLVVFGPIGGRGGQSVDGVKQLGAKRVRRYRAPVEIPQERLAGFRLRFGQYFDFEGAQREPRRCRTSVQGAACTRPARNSTRRRFTSVRHCCETVASSAVSRLSRRATANAERSSTGRPRTSSRRCSTRAFIGASLAPLVPWRKGPTDNRRLVTFRTQQRNAAARRMLPAGQRQR